jgi:chloramphenicol O-acetyltransferase type A
MRQLDLATWSRRDHFKFFGAYDHPHFSMCANVDVTAFRPAVRQRGHSLTVSIVYALARVSNEIPEFRYRIREGGVVEHESVDPAVTILVDEDTFSFCVFDYVDDFSIFAAGASERIAYVKEHPWVDTVVRDNYLYMTAIPWVSFTSFMHPVNLEQKDSVPRFAWGKFFEEDDLLKMPLNVQAHHALMDGVHMGKFYTEVQGYFDHPELVLDAR